MAHGVHKGLSTAKVVAAAAALADRVGYDDLTLAVLAAELDVRVPSLYKHVDGLADLRLRVAALGADGLRERIAAAVAGLRGPVALAAFCGGYREFAVCHPGQYVALIRNPAAMPAAPAGEGTAGVLPRVLTECGVLPRDLDGADTAVRSLLRGFVIFELTGAIGTSEQTERSFTDVVDLVLRSVPAGRPSLMRGFRLRGLVLPGV